MAFQPPTHGTSPASLPDTAYAWLRQQSPSSPLLILAANHEVGQELIHRAALELGAVMDWRCITPAELARTLPNMRASKPAVLLLDLPDTEQQVLIDACCRIARDVMDLRGTAEQTGRSHAVSQALLPEAILDHARSGVRFDDIAIVLSDAESQIEPVRAALHRASIPAYFATGTRQPDPQGMAFLALLRFWMNGFGFDDLSEYLCLSSQEGLEAIIESQLASHGIPTSLQAWRAIQEPRIATALGPMLAELDAMPPKMLWPAWRKALERLATVAIDQPQSIVRAMQALDDASTGEILELDAVLDILTPLLASTTVPSEGHRYGQVYVCTESQLSGHTFKVVMSCVADGATASFSFELRYLHELFAKPASSSTNGQARFLLADNPHLGRALRQRALRWRKGRWSSADGFAKTSAASQVALDKHRPEHRAYSPTALQLLASCPYKFFLYAISGVKPRAVPKRILSMDPLQRGSFVHDVLYEFLSACRLQALLPLRAEQLVQARELLKRTLAATKAKYQSLWAPLSTFVWEQEMHDLHADLEEWLERTAEEAQWQPWLFELAFGLPGRGAQDPRSVNHSVKLDSGLQIRGAIDLVERHVTGAIRATDFKTGKARTKNGLMLGGGEILQPLLYALLLEKMFPEQRVTGGRLYYCSSNAAFAEVNVPLTEHTRAAIALLKNALDEGFDNALFVASPTEGRCTFCDYQVICGPNEEARVRLLRTARDLPKLIALRESL